mmetsp:Transcript_51607/g.83726  ORF Transcript_51607/g.83726 Transcript_51607/m.83726 type:complete len:244 (-) Transcript_51607:1065-1796(-)
MGCHNSPPRADSHIHQQLACGAPRGELSLCRSYLLVFDLHRNACCRHWRTGMEKGRLGALYLRTSGRRPSSQHDCYTFDGLHGEMGMDGGPPARLPDLFGCLPCAHLSRRPLGHSRVHHAAHHIHGCSHMAPAVSSVCHCCELPCSWAVLGASHRQSQGRPPTAAGRCQFPLPLPPRHCRGLFCRQRGGCAADLRFPVDEPMVRYSGIRVRRPWPLLAILSFHRTCPVAAAHGQCRLAHGVKA